MTTIKIMFKRDWDDNPTDKEILKELKSFLRSGVMQSTNRSNKIKITLR